MLNKRTPVFIALAALTIAALACGSIDVGELQTTLEAGSGTLEAEATRLGPTLQVEATNAAATLAASGIQETAEAAVPGLQQTLEAAVPGLQATAEAFGETVEIDGTTVSQWAVSANATSEFNQEGWSAQQATGLPDVEEGACGDITGAWASAESTGVDTLTLTYAIPVVPTAINVVEIFNPGQITTVTVTTVSGEERVVYEAEPAIVDDCPRTFAIPVSDVTQPINRVAITVDQTGRNWNEIDAVQLVGEVPLE